MGDAFQLRKLQGDVALDRVAVLASGGLDSSVLLADIAQEAEAFPLYFRVGLAWEDEELAALHAFIAALNSPNVRPVTVLSVPIQPVYGDHWGITGKGVPGAGGDDGELFLPGRNVVLIGLAAVWCSTHQASRIAIGSLGGNPFPDASPEFFDSFARALSQGLDHPISVEAPFRGMEKPDLIRDHPDLPLHLTVTCMVPKNGVHCGRCLKCEERQRGFAAVGVADRTVYSTSKELE